MTRTEDISADEGSEGWDGRQLRDARLARGLSQGALADHFGVTDQTIRAWERGSLPQRRLRAEVAEFLGESEARLFGASVALPQEQHRRPRLVAVQAESIAAAPGDSRSLVVEAITARLASGVPFSDADSAVVARLLDEL